MTQNSQLQQYWEQLLRHEREGLFGLYQELYTGLLQYGRVLVGDEELTKDVINQLFLYLWDKHLTLSTPRDIKAYVVVSFRRMLLYEDKKLRQFGHSSLEQDLESMPGQASAEYEKITAETQLEVTSRLRHALSALSPRQQELLRMKYYENLSYEEIAERTGLSIRTVYNKTHEALQRLRKSLPSGMTAGYPPSFMLLLLLLELASNQ